MIFNSNLGVNPNYFNYTNYIIKNTGTQQKPDSSSDFTSFPNLSQKTGQIPTTKKIAKTATPDGLKLPLKPSGPIHNKVTLKKQAPGIINSKSLATLPTINQTKTKTGIPPKSTANQSSKPSRPLQIKKREEKFNEDELFIINNLSDEDNEDYYSTDEETQPNQVQTKLPSIKPENKETCPEIGPQTLDSNEKARHKKTLAKLGIFPLANNKTNILAILKDNRVVAASQGSMIENVSPLYQKAFVNGNDASSIYFAEIAVLNEHFSEGLAEKLIMDLFFKTKIEEIYTKLCLCLCEKVFDRLDPTLLGFDIQGEFNKRIKRFCWTIKV